MTLREHRLDVYPVTLHAAYSRDEWAALRDTIDSLPESEARGVTSRDALPDEHGDDACHVSILIQTLYGPRDVIDSIAHEAVHAAGAILEYVGEDNIKPWSEPHAYLVGFIASWLWEGLPDGWDHNAQGSHP